MSPGTHPSYLQVVLAVGVLTAGAVSGTASGMSPDALAAIRQSSMSSYTTGWIVAPQARMVTWASPAIAPPADNATLLARVHDLSGLTWQQIARLFDVSARAVYLWLAGGRMSAQNSRALRSLDSHVRSLDGTPDQRRRLLLQPSGGGRSWFDERRYQHASNDEDINRHLEPLVQV